MIDSLNFLRGANLDTLSVVVRLVLAVVCGGVIGLERERKRRPAGFRTHILICLVYIPGSAWLQVCMCSVLDIQRDIRSLCGLLEKLHSVTTLYEKRMRRGHPLALVRWPPYGSLPPVYPGHHDLPQFPFTLSSPSILPNKDPSLNLTTLPGQYCIPYLSICWPWTGF